MVKSSKEPNSYENAIEQLEEIISSMESDKIPLDQLIQHFEKGVKLSQFCRAKLDEMEQKIEILVKDDGQQGEWTDFTLNQSQNPHAPRQSTTTPTSAPQNENELPF